MIHLVLPYTRRNCHKSRLNSVVCYFNYSLNIWKSPFQHLIRENISKLSLNSRFSAYSVFATYSAHSLFGNASSFSFVHYSRTMKYFFLLLSILCTLCITEAAAPKEVGMVVFSDSRVPMLFFRRTWSTILSIWMKTHIQSISSNKLAILTLSFSIRLLEIALVASSARTWL